MDLLRLGLFQSNKVDQALKLLHQVEVGKLSLQQWRQSVNELGLDVNEQVELNDKLDEIANDADG